MIYFVLCVRVCENVDLGHACAYTSLRLRGCVGVCLRIIIIIIWNTHMCVCENVDLGTAYFASL